MSSSGSLIWAPGSATGVEGETIALGAIMPVLPPDDILRGLLVFGIPVGATLRDGVHSFTATVGHTWVNMGGWALGDLTIVTPSDANLTLTAIGWSGRSQFTAREVVIVDPLPPTVVWSPSASSGTEGATLGLGAVGYTVRGLAGDENGLQSLVVSAIPLGATLSDGSRSFTASASATSVNVAGWNLSGLRIVTANAADFTLTVTATVSDRENDLSTASAREQVDVAPLAPTLLWSPASASGIAGAAIPLGALMATVNGRAGDSNRLLSLVVDGVPTGVRLADGVHTFAATSIAHSVDVTGWNLSRLTVTAPSAANFTLTAAATVRDADGDTARAGASEVVVVSGAALDVTWSPAAVAGVEGSPLALGAVTETSGGLTRRSLVIGGIPVGAALSDGGHSFTATTTRNAVDVGLWSLSRLTVDPSNDANFVLSVTATAADGGGRLYTAADTERVTVTPLPPSLAWPPASVTGAVGSAIPLGAIDYTVNGLGGDANVLQSIVVGAIPGGVTLSDGTRSFTATPSNSAVNILGWRLPSLTVTAASAMAFALTATATVRDPEGDTSRATASETVTAVASPTGGAQHPHLLDGYAARPPWLVAGVDYVVGVPAASALKDPLTISLPGVSLNAASHVVSVSGNNVTLDGYDFSREGGWKIYVTGANDRVTNSNFKVGANNLVPIQGGKAASNLTVEHSTIDGGGVGIAGNPAAVWSLISYEGTGTLTVQHNWLLNGPQHAVEFGAGPGTLIEQYNLMESFGYYKGAHVNYSQFSRSVADNSQINFNTVYQPTAGPDGFPVGGGEGLQVQAQLGSKITDTEVNNNVIIAARRSSGVSMSYPIYVIQDSGNTVDGVTVSNNYLDYRGAYGAFYPPRGTDLSFSNNINMVTGASIPSPLASLSDPAESFLSVGAFHSMHA